MSFYGERAKKHLEKLLLVLEPCMGYTYAGPHKPRSEGTHRLYLVGEDGKPVGYEVPEAVACWIGDVLDARDSLNGSLKLQKMEEDGWTEK